MNVFDKINRILEATTASEKRIRILKLGTKGQTELFRREALRRTEKERKDALKKAAAKRTAKAIKTSEEEISGGFIGDRVKDVPFKT